jgi:hypothetical protein
MPTIFPRSNLNAPRAVWVKPNVPADFFGCGYLITSTTGLHFETHQFSTLTPYNELKKATRSDFSSGLSNIPKR